jgi:hypothetical protein
LFFGKGGGRQRHVARHVAFTVCRFAFAAYRRLAKPYMRIIKTSCPTPQREGTPCNLDAWRSVMKIFARLFGLRRDSSLSTAIERQRLANTMPGQTAAIAANRLGMLVG